MSVSAAQNATNTHMTPQNKIFIEDDGRLRDLAEAVMAQHSTMFTNCDLDEVGFVIVEGDKGADYLAKAIKVPPIYRLFLKKKFLILFNATTIENGAAGKQDLIMLHELIHINTSLDQIVDHDTEDFSYMLRAWGLDWKTNNKSLMPLSELEKYTPWSMPTKPTATGPGPTAQPTSLGPKLVTQQPVSLQGGTVK